MDAETLEQIEQRGIEGLLEEPRAELREGEYRPKAVLRRYVDEADGRKRPPGLPAVRDRVVQMAATLVLEPILEAGSKDASYGFRPERSATDALEALRERAHAGGGNHVWHADVRDYFGRLDRERPLSFVGARVSDRRPLELIRLWLEAEVMEAGEVSERTLGTPQGGVISPLLSNIYLDRLDTARERQHRNLGLLVRDADDFVVMCDTAEQWARAAREIEAILRGRKPELHPEKTRQVDLTETKEGFDLLGCHLRKKASGRLLEKGVRKHSLHRWPSARRMKRARQRVKEQTDRRRNGVKDVRELVRRLNPILRGWGAYFRTGNAAVNFDQADRSVTRRLRRLEVERKGRNLRAGEAAGWTQDFFRGHGSHRLRGTLRYPEAA